MAMESLRIFVSSPGDVTEERIISKRVLDRLADRFRDVIHIEAVFWEHEPLLASQTFQTQIISPANADIVICILWSRLGTRLPKNIVRADGSAYASGTEYEFETALEAARSRGAPQLLIYRKTIKPYVSLDDSRAARAALDQKEALDAFLKKWFHDADGALKAAFHTFDEPSAFERDLEEHLQKLIEQLIERLGHAVLPMTAQIESGLRSEIRNPFRGLDIFDVEHASIFFGRTRAVSEVLGALRQQFANEKAFVLVLGMSGCGKSSLVRAGVLPLLTQAGIIQRTSLWRRAILRPSDSTGDVFHGLAAALVRPDALPELTSDGATQLEIAQILREDPRSAAVLAKGALSQAAGAAQIAEGKEIQPRAKLAIVVDQFEELFTLESVTAKRRRDFVDVLVSLACSRRVCVIATLRSDFYARCAELPQLVWLKEGPGQYRPPSADAWGIRSNDSPSGPMRRPAI